VKPLSDAKAIAELTGDTFVFPSPIDPKKPASRQEVCRLWRQIADAAGIKAGSRIGTHSFRRAFANRLRNAPLRELQDLGGWKTERTVVTTYLQPDQNAQRAVLEALE
jgi:integrase